MLSSLLEGLLMGGYIYGKGSFQYRISFEEESTEGDAVDDKYTHFERKAGMTSN